MSRPWSRPTCGSSARGTATGTASNSPTTSRRLREWSGEAAALRREILDQVALDEGLELKELAEVAGGVSVQRAWQLRKQARERAEKGSA
jgi:hypothetical protein